MKRTYKAYKRKRWKEKARGKIDRHAGRGSDLEAMGSWESWSEGHRWGGIVEDGLQHVQSISYLLRIPNELALHSTVTFTIYIYCIYTQLSLYIYARIAVIRCWNSAQNTLFKCHFGFGHSILTGNLEQSSPLPTHSLSSVISELQKRKQSTIWKYIMWVYSFVCYFMLFEYSVVIKCNKIGTSIHILQVQVQASHVCKRTAVISSFTFDWRYTAEVHLWKIALSRSSTGLELLQVIEQ